MLEIRLWGDFLHAEVAVYEPYANTLLRKRGGTEFGVRYRMDLRHELQALEQDPQIVVSVEFLGRGSCQACIGDITHGYREIGKVDSFNAAVEWLQAKARQNYPESQYVQHLQK